MQFIFVDRGWQQCHGFFALMGGFALVIDGQSTHTLRPNELQSLSDSDRINFPEITENEIQDRSKSDSLSKGIVVVQTGWFALQCIARHVERLPVTQVEMMTLTFAMNNFATYWFWWNKPKSPSSPPPDSQTKSRDTWQLLLAVVGGSGCIYIIPRASEK